MSNQMLSKLMTISLILIVCLKFSDCQKKKIRSSCTCNFKLVDEPETKLINVFPNKVRRSTCDQDAIEGCKQLCIKREAKNINGDLTQKYPNTDLRHGDIICNWLEKDLDDQELTVEAVLECNNQKYEIDTDLLFGQRLTCKLGEFKV